MLMDVGFAVMILQMTFYVVAVAWFLLALRKKWTEFHRKQGQKQVVTKLSEGQLFEIGVVRQLAKTGYVPISRDRIKEEYARLSQTL